MRIRVYISCKFDQYNCCCSIDTTYQALKFTFLSAAARWISRIAINTFREWFRSFSNECQLPAQCLNRAFKMPTRNIKSKFAAKWYESIANKLPIINKLLWLIPASTKQSSLFGLPTLAGLIYLLSIALHVIIHSGKYGDHLSFPSKSRQHNYLSHKSVLLNAAIKPNRPTVSKFAAIYMARILS